MSALKSGFTPTRCFNKDCIKHTENYGGIFRLVGGEFYCEDCAGWMHQMNSGKNLWDYDTTHFNGEKIHIGSHRRMLELCKQHGVSNQAAENNERNWK